MRIISILILVALIFPMGADARTRRVTYQLQNSIICEPAGKPKGVVIALHWGGFVVGSVEASRTECRRFAAEGYRGWALDYPKNNYPAAVTHVRNAATFAINSGYRTFISGQSAGGSLALDAAAFVPGLAAVVAEGAPVDYTKIWDQTAWTNLGLPSTSLRQWFSPKTWASNVKIPTRVQASPSDKAVNYTHSIIWDNTAPQSTFKQLAGDHLKDSGALQDRVNWINSVNTKLNRR